MNNNCCEAHMPRVFAKNICDNERLFIFQRRKQRSGGKTIIKYPLSHGQMDGLLMNDET